MDGLEGPLMITAMVLIFGVIFAKAMATQMIARMDRQINEVAQVQSEAKNRLKTASGQKAIAERNRSMLEAKKNKVHKKISRLKKELQEIEEENSIRRQRADARKVD